MRTTDRLAPLALVALFAATAQAQDKSTEWKAPATAASKKNPVTADAASIEAGRAIYRANCLSCHGELGKGDGPAAAALERHPGDLTRAAMATQTDGELFWKITNGRKPMPTWQTTLTSKQRWEVLNFVRTLGPAPLAAPAAPQGGPSPAPTPGPNEPKRVDAPPGGPKALTPEEGEALKKDVQKLKEELAALKGQPAEGGEPGSETSSLGELEKKLREVREITDDLHLGTTRFLLAGTAHADFNWTNPTRNTDARSSAAFGAGLEIDVLWKVSDRILFEGGADFETNTQNSFDVSLALANVAFMLNDYSLARAGLMPTAFSRYKETLDAPWINKMPDAPFLVAIVPDTTIGLEARGAVPLGDMRLIYSVYTFNDPILNTTDPVQAGTVSFQNFQGFDDVPGFGAKLGFRPHAGVEIGGAFLWSKVGTRGTGFRRTDVTQIDAYARFQKKLDAGTLDVQAEWVWQHVRRATYQGAIDPTTGLPAFGPFRFLNERQSGYVQVGWRLTGVDNDYVKNIELVARGDWIQNPRNAPIGASNDVLRASFGVDYWFTPSIVLKTAYEFQTTYVHRGQGKDTDVHAVVAQLGMGF